MEENEDQPEDVRNASPVEEEIKKAEIDEQSAQPAEEYEPRKGPPQRSSRVGQTGPKRAAKTREEHCAKRLKKKTKDPKGPVTAKVLVSDKPCTIPKLDVIPRHCLSKKEWLELLATPSRKCPPPCGKKEVERKLRPVSPRINELALPTRQRMMTTLQDRGDILPAELVDKLINILEGETCLTPEQAEQFFRDKSKKPRSRKPPKSKCKTSIQVSKKLDATSSPFDKDAVNCQYVMAEAFVKSLLQWKCTLPRDEFKDIAEVIIKRLSTTLEYTPVDNADRTTQQMKFLADIIAAWIAGVLFEVAEAHREDLEKECEDRKKVGAEEETDETEESEDEEFVPQKVESSKSAKKVPSSESKESEDEKDEGEISKDDMEDNDDDAGDSGDRGDGGGGGPGRPGGGGVGGAGGGSPDSSEPREDPIGATIDQDEPSGSEDTTDGSPDGVQEAGEPSSDGTHKEADELPPDDQGIREETPPDVVPGGADETSADSISKDGGESSPTSVLEDAGAPPIETGIPELAEGSTGVPTNLIESVPPQDESEKTFEPSPDDGAVGEALAEASNDDETSDGAAAIDIRPLGDDESPSPSGQALDEASPPDFQVNELLAPTAEPSAAPSSMLGDDGDAEPVSGFAPESVTVVDGKASEIGAVPELPSGTAIPGSTPAIAENLEIETAPEVLEDATIPFAAEDSPSDQLIVPEPTEAVEEAMGIKPAKSDLEPSTKSVSAKTISMEPSALMKQDGSLKPSASIIRAEELSKVGIPTKFPSEGLESSQRKDQAKDSEFWEGNLKEMLQTDVPFLDLLKIFDRIENAVADEVENQGEDLVTDRIHRAVYEKLERLAKAETPERLTPHLKDVLDVLSGKIAQWVRRMLTESEILFLNDNPPLVESEELRSFGEWVGEMSERANNWTVWIQNMIGELMKMRETQVTRSDWQNWTRRFGQDALQWRRYYLESVHCAHHNRTMLAGREVVKTGEKKYPEWSIQEREIKTIDFLQE